MMILDKYIFKQVLTATILGIIIFIIVWISPEILFRIIKQTIYGEITYDVAIKLFFLEIPEILGKAIPVGLMLGSLIVFNRLSIDSELTIIRSIGVSFKRLMLPIILLGVMGTAVCYITYDTLIPYSNTIKNKIKKRINQDNFVYVDKTKQGKPKQILIVGKYDGKDIENIRLISFSDSQENGKDKPLVKNITLANTAIYTQQKWILKDGIEYKIAPDGVYQRAVSFNSKNIFEGDLAKKSYDLLNFSSQKTSQMTISSLKDYLYLLKELKINEEARYIKNKYYQRYAQALGCILFALCGVILGFSKPREKKFLGLIVGVLVIFLYYITVPFLEMLAQKGIAPPLVTAWVPNFIVLATLLIFIKQKNI